MSVEQLMVGAIDLHSHCSPNDIVGSRVDAVECAQQAKAAGMKGVVIKNQLFSSAPIAWLANKIVDCPILIGGLVLNLFGSLPREGRTIAYDQLTFRVLRMKGNRILEVEVRRVTP